MSSRNRADLSSEIDRSSERSCVSNQKSRKWKHCRWMSGTMNKRKCCWILHFVFKMVAATWNQRECVIMLLSPGRWAQRDAIAHLLLHTLSKWELHRSRFFTRTSQGDLGEFYALRFCSFPTSWTGTLKWTFWFQCCVNYLSSNFNHASCIENLQIFIQCFFVLCLIEELQRGDWSLFATLLPLTVTDFQSVQ